MTQRPSVKWMCGQVTPRKTGKGAKKAAYYKFVSNTDIKNIFLVRAEIKRKNPENVRSGEFISKNKNHSQI